MCGELYKKYTLPAETESTHFMYFQLQMLKLIKKGKKATAGSLPSESTKC